MYKLAVMLMGKYLHSLSIKSETDVKEVLMEGFFSVLPPHGVGKDVIKTNTLSIASATYFIN